MQTSLFSYRTQTKSSCWSFCLYLVLLVSAFSQVKNVDGVCGYSSCPKPKPGHINVHLVPHSHDDVGWVKTVDEYYLGLARDQHEGAVQYILDSVVMELSKDPSRKFIYVESAFFWRWWRSQDEHTQKLVKSLVNNGQLEFISGGWCGNDEGATHYNALIDQMSLGLRYLNETFGVCATPKAAWQIDTFGHSREMASLFAQFGFDGLFIGRMDYQYKSYRYRQHELEMIWNSNPSIGKEAELFTSILYNYYQPPSGFCFDQICNDEPINDDPKLSNYNVKEKVESFIRIARAWASPYDTNNTLMTMGSDFHYMNANMWYKNLDKLIKHVNSYNFSSKFLAPVHLFYSTPTCYLQAVHDAKKPLPIKNSDFFPYSNDPYGFWSGYFTSRPTFKYYIHKANNFLQACKQVVVGTTKGKANAESIEKVFELSEPVAIVQHHDAITGTATQVVTDDYSYRLAVGMKSCESVLSDAFSKLQTGTNHLPTHPTFSFANQSSSYEFCQLLNISSCAATEESGDFIVSVYNPLAKDLNNSYIRLPVSSQLWTVQSQFGEIPSEVFAIPGPVLNIPGRESKALYEVVFKVDSLPALSLTSFRVKKQETLKDAPPANEKLVESSKGNVKEDVIIENSNGVRISIDGNTGLLKSIARGTVELPLEQNFYYYVGMAGNNSEFHWRASGAYVLRPNTSEADGHRPNLPTPRTQSFDIHRGKHVTEVHQVFTDWISQVIRLYDKSDLVEFEWLVGPIPIDDGYGKEIITRYSTNIPTKGAFFTDSNGRQLIKRQRDFRDFPFINYEKVAGNYYPVTSRMLITAAEDLTTDGLSLVVLNDRSQGGTSMNDGEVELMVHRRLLWDDAFGVAEALNETAFGTGLVARGKHWVLLAGEGTGIPLSSHRQEAQNIFMDNILAFTDAPKSTSVLHNSTFTAGLSNIFNLGTRQTALTAFRDILPVNIHLLTVEPLSESQVLLRLEHFYEQDEHPVYSNTVTISSQEILQRLPFVKSLQETNLGANQWKDEVKRFDWIPKSKTPWYASAPQHNQAVEDIVLGPMDIKTYILSVN